LLQVVPVLLESGVQGVRLVHRDLLDNRDHRDLLEIVDPMGLRDRQDLLVSRVVPDRRELPDRLARVETLDSLASKESKEHSDFKAPQVTFTCTD